MWIVDDQIKQSQGDRDQARSPQCETQDDGGRAVVTTFHNEDDCLVDEEDHEPIWSGKSCSSR